MRFGVRDKILSHKIWCQESVAISWCHLEYIGIKGLITRNLLFSPHMYFLAFIASEVY